MAVAPIGTSAEEEKIENLGPPPRSRRLAWYRLTSIVLVVGGWEILGQNINPLFLAPPSAILVAAYEMTLSGQLPVAFAQSVVTLLVGFVAASLIGIILGLLIGRYKPVEASTDWIVNALYATPLVAIIPLVIIWFGLGFTAKLFIVFKITVFAVLINTAAGVRNVPEPLIQLGRAFGATERQIFGKIILPSALPYMATGLRLGIGRALIGMVVAEFYTSITGLGALIVIYGNQYEVAKMFVPILVLMLLGITLSTGVRKLEESVAPWKKAEQNN
tara:strand:- start:58015 stop:58839 length:825 start_codon:yes stop_codon:yes gene_type:complete